MTTLTFRHGTVELRGLPATAAPPPSCTWDKRTGCWRAPAMAYRAILRAVPGVDDTACSDGPLDDGARVHRVPRPYQLEALQAWRDHDDRRGVVALPTGAGKSQVALMAIDDVQRSTLVVAPTLDLVRQWYDLLRLTFGTRVGVVGGGDHDVQPLTVTTYESARLHMEHLGARFGLVVFDECHHLHGPQNALGARMCLAPCRLGLSATPADSIDDDLIGPVILRRDAASMPEYLAPWETVRIEVELTASERAEYDEARATYTSFLQRQGIRMGGPRGWTDFVMRSARTDEGRAAMQAWRRQREIAFAAPAKLDVVDDLLQRHRADQTILFTDDNSQAYAIARRCLVPIITHRSKVGERSEVLQGFARGEYGAVVTSRVLNEGIDVPDANVAIVVSGSGSVREHVQRLGRVLRQKEGKRAVLYEIVARGTSEHGTSRRRQSKEAP